MKIAIKSINLATNCNNFKTKIKQTKIIINRLV